MCSGLACRCWTVFAFITKLLLLFLLLGSFFLALNCEDKAFEGYNATIFAYGSNVLVYEVEPVRSDGLREDSYNVGSSFIGP